MPFGNLGMWEMLLILVVLLLVFGAKRLPEIGSALGKGIREFKGSVKEIENDINRSEVSRPQQDQQGTLPRDQAEQAPPPPPREGTERETSSPNRENEKPDA